jgi:hypothetical protein
MTVWGIADLHLSFARPERRERYAGRWREHAERIAHHWREMVRPDDVVLMPGDISMARNHRELQPDLAWLDRLPGLKVLAPGNHDRWWNGVENIRPLLRRSLRAVEGDALQIGPLIACGARGVPVPSNHPTAAENTALDRELAALDRALEHARRLRAAEEPIYVLWHYPPFDAHHRAGPCVERFLHARVTACVYGHIHTMGQWGTTLQGRKDGVRYSCVAADAIGFRPLRLDGPPR